MRERKFNPLQRVNVMVHDPQFSNKVRLFGPDGMLATDSNVALAKKEASQLRTNGKIARVFYLNNISTPRQTLQREYQVARRQILGSFKALQTVVSFKNVGPLSLTPLELRDMLWLKERILNRLEIQYQALDAELKRQGA